MRFKDWDINLKIRLIGEAFVNTSFWMVFPFLAIYFAQTFGLVLTSVLMIISQIIGVICGLFGGYFADHYGRRRMMLIAIAGEGSGYALFAFASLPIFDSGVIGFIGFTIASSFSNFYQPAAQAMIADVVDVKHRSYVFSVFYMMINIAVVIGPLIGAVFFTNYRFALLLLISVGSFFLYALLYRYSHETAPMLLNPSIQKQQHLQLTWREVVVNQVKDYRVIFKDKVFLFFIIAGVLVGQTFMQLDLFIPVYIEASIEKATLLNIGKYNWTLTGTQLFGLILAINGGIVAIFTVAMTKFMTRFREKVSFIGSALLYGLSIFIFGLFPHPWIFILCIVLFSIAELMTAGIQQNFVSKIAPAEQRGMYFSAAQLRNSFARVLAPISITLSALVGYKVTAIILTLLGFVAAWFYHKMFTIYKMENSSI